MAAFHNQATLTYSGGTVTSNIASGEILEVLSATKTAVEAEYAQGAEVTYALNIINTGTAPFTDLAVIDNLGAYTFGEQTLYPMDYVDGSIKYFVDGALQSAPTLESVSPLTLTGINIPAGSNAALLYTVRFNDYASPEAGGTVVNTATVSGGVIAITASETVAAAQAPVLDIVKTVNPTTVSENGQITYTMEIENFGNTEAGAADNIVVSDVFDPQLTDITVSYNGTEWAENTNYTYDAATGQFATTAGAITVPAATFEQNAETGAWTVQPSVSTLTVTGTV